MPKPPFWVEEKEYADGTGRSLYVKPYDIFSNLTYFPDENRAWYYSQGIGSQSIRFHCDSWKEADRLYEQLKAQNEKENE